MKPTTEIQSALEGAQLETITPASMSALRFVIYRKACEVLAANNNAQRKRMIESHPEGIQALLRAECRRVYDLRRKNA